MSPASLRLAVGDARQEVTLQPTFRPEITALSALVRLPDYLGIDAPITKGLRGGGLSIVKGSRVAVTATANRELASASIDGHDVVSCERRLMACGGWRCLRRYRLDRDCVSPDARFGEGDAGATYSPPSTSTAPMRIWLPL